MATEEEVRVANKVIAEQRAKAQQEVQAIANAKHASNQKMAGYVIVFLIALLGAILVHEKVLPLSTTIVG